MVFWYDEYFGNKNWRNGQVPDGLYPPGWTKIYFCCRTDGFAANEMILPTESPFALMMSTNRECQKVKGMQVRKEWFKWDCDDWTGAFDNWLSDERTSGPIKAAIDGAGNVLIPYCYYYKEN